MPKGWGGLREGRSSEAAKGYGQLHADEEQEVHSWRRTVGETGRRYRDFERW